MITTIDLKARPQIIHQGIKNTFITTYLFIVGERGNQQQERDLSEWLMEPL